MSFHKVPADVAPQGWAVVPLTDLVVAKAGNSKLFKGRMHKAPASNLFQGFSASGADIWTDSYEYDTDGVVVSAVGARCGKSFLAKGKWVAVANTHVVIPFEDSLDTKFLWYGINDEDFWIKSGTAQPFVVVSKSFERLFAIPPRAEQTRIVEKLEELLSDLYAGVAELKAAQKKLAQYRQSLLKAAVEGTLTADWRAAQASANATQGRAPKAPKPNHPAETGAQLLERILTERRARWEAKQLAKFNEQGKAPPKDWQTKYPEPMLPETADLPALPHGWVRATIDQLAEVGTGVTPLRSRSEYFNNGTIPWVTSGALNSETVASATELVTEIAVKECRLELYPVGSLLVAMYGEGKTRGKCSELLIPAAINQAIAAIVLEPVAQSFKAYLKAFLLDSYERMRAQASGGVQPNLNLQIVKAISLPLPPIAEQFEITQLLEGQFSHISQQQLAVERGIKQCTAQRQNILRAAFSGELVPQDPNDEPASVLLERIRAEREERAKQPKKRQPKQPKEIAAVVSQLIDVLAEAGDWLEAQEAFRRCGVADGAPTERIEELYAELRKLDKAGRLAVEAVTDAQGRKLYDKLKLLAA